MLTGNTGVAPANTRRTLVQRLWNAADTALMGGQGRVDDLRVRAQDLLELVEALLQLAPVTGAQAWLLALFVLALGTVAATPAAGGLPAIAFYLCTNQVSLYSPLMCTAVHKAAHKARLGRGGSSTKKKEENIRRVRTFLCLQSSHLEMGFSSARFLLFDSGSGEKVGGRGSASDLSSAEDAAGE